MGSGRPFRGCSEIPGSAEAFVRMGGARLSPAKDALVFSDLDIGLPDKTTDQVYLKTLQEILPRLIDEVQPDKSHTRRT